MGTQAGKTAGGWRSALGRLTARLRGTQISEQDIHAVRSEILEAPPESVSGRAWSEQAAIAHFVDKALRDGLEEPSTYVAASRRLVESLALQIDRTAVGASVRVFAVQIDGDLATVVAQNMPGQLASPLPATTTLALAAATERTAMQVDCWETYPQLVSHWAPSKWSIAVPMPGSLSGGHKPLVVEVHGTSTPPRAAIGDMIRSMVLLTDTIVSVRIREKGILEDNVRLKTLLDSAPVGLITFDTQLVGTFYNPAARVMLELDPSVPASDLVRAPPYRVLHHGNLMRQEDYPVVRAIRENRYVAPVEMEIEHPDGRNLAVLASASPLRDTAGQVTGGVVMLSDITPQLRLRRRLEHRRRQAEEADERKTRFLAAAAHDIRTPASAISLLTGIVARSLIEPGEPSPTARNEMLEIVDELQTCANGLVTLVTELMEISRPDAGEKSLSVTTFEIGRLAKDEAALFQQTAQSKQLDLRVQAPASGEAIRLRTDRVKLGRILGNLIGNAVKFTPEGGSVTVTWSRVSKEASGGGISLTVADTGPGIPSESIDKIFDEYFQVRQYRQTGSVQAGGGVGPGVGLGLSICRRLAATLGIQLSVSSEIGKGSVFTLGIPALLLE